MAMCRSLGSFHLRQIFVEIIIFNKQWKIKLGKKLLNETFYQWKFPKLYCILISWIIVMYLVHVPLST